jgi:hypothetical protein
LDMLADYHQGDDDEYRCPDCHAEHTVDGMKAPA